MDLISTFLGKFKLLTPPQSVFKKALCGAVKAVLAIDIPLERVRVDRSIAYLDINPLLRSEIRLKKTELLTLANKELGQFGRALKDIR